MAQKLSVGVNEKGAIQGVLSNYANRHGLIAGATGTGKTFTLHMLAERFSDAGVPVFTADVKGDLNGFAFSGERAVKAGKIAERAAELSEADFAFQAYPTAYWDLYGEKGLRVRATISEVGPLLLARILDVNETQEGVLNIIFRIADEQGLFLIDLKDLRALLNYIAENAADVSVKYGNVTAQSVGAIMRQILTLENQGGDQFFGEPALDLHDFIRCDADGRGYINVLSADKLMNNPRLYATFLLWALSELFENLPEVGDLEKPKAVFFFDEAHLLFTDAPEALIRKIEQVVRLIRSKGVGIYFVTQNPIDIPETVLGQLGNRVQHALRAFTPRDQKAVRSAAETFRVNPELDISTVITELKTGEALVSFLDESGAPSVTEKVKILPPRSLTEPASLAETQGIVFADPLRAKYEKDLDRESAYEMLNAQAAPAEVETPVEQQTESSGGWLAGLTGLLGGGSGRQSIGETVIKTAARNVTNRIAREVGNQLIRGIFGSLSRRR